MMDTVNAPIAGIVCTATGPATHLCPYRDEVDHGSITVAWRTTSRTIELHSLAAHIASYASEAISHEGLVADLADAVRREAVELVYVTWQGSTAGLAVAVEVG